VNAHGGLTRHADAVIEGGGSVYLAAGVLAAKESEIRQSRE